MKNKVATIKYAFLSLTGIMLLSGALWYLPVLPEVEACGNTPNCMNWEVTSLRILGGCNHIKGKDLIFAGIMIDKPRLSVRSRPPLP